MMEFVVMFELVHAVMLIQAVERWLELSLARNALSASLYDSSPGNSVKKVCHVNLCMTAPAFIFDYLPSSVRKIKTSNFIHLCIPHACLQSKNFLALQQFYPDAVPDMLQELFEAILPKGPPCWPWNCKSRSDLFLGQMM